VAENDCTLKAINNENMSADLGLNNMSKSLAVDCLSDA
jgi:hypothetical protein